MFSDRLIAIARSIVGSSLILVDSYLNLGRVNSTEAYSVDTVVVGEFY